MSMPREICLLLFKQPICAALALARARAGRSIAARMAIIAITTSSSMRVKAARVGFGRDARGCGLFTMTRRIVTSWNTYQVLQRPTSTNSSEKGKGSFWFVPFTEWRVENSPWDHIRLDDAYKTP